MKQVDFEENYVETSHLILITNQLNRLYMIANKP